MKVLICGIGKITGHLLRRLGENWQATLIDQSEEKLKDAVSRHPNIERTIRGDASSPVVLDDAGISEFEYILILTGSDKVNLAIARVAGEQGVTHVLSLVNEQENLRSFQELGARTILGSALLARTIYHYLEDPRISVTPLTLSEAEVLEVDVSQYFRMVGKRVSTLMEEGWRVAALFRGSRLIFPAPEMRIEPEDRLIIIGRPDLFKPVCDVLECGQPHFPLAYGQGLLLALSLGGEHGSMIMEGMHLAQNTKVRHVTVLCRKEDLKVDDQLQEWSQNIDIRVEHIEEDLLEAVKKANDGDNYGLVVVDPFKGSLLKLLGKPVLVAFAHSLPCPLLISRRTQPYKRILVPFNGTPVAELALEVGIDLGRQVGSEISVAVVDEPEFIKGREEGDWVQSVSERVQEIAHVHKMELEVIQKRGNPVKEAVALSEDFNLMVVGSSTKDKELFSPHVGELLASEARCSVLIVTA